MGLLGMVGVGAAIIAYQNAASPVVDAAQYQDASARRVAAPPALAMAVPEPEPQGLAALIVNDSAASSPVVGDAAPLAVSPPVTAPPVQQPNVTAGTQSNPRKPVRTESVATRLPAPAARRAESSVSQRLAGSSTRQSAQPTAVPARPQAAHADKDVALLAALVAHGATQSAPRATSPAARTVDNTSKSAKNNIQSASAATAVKTRERNRDIVERGSTDTTDALLQRCKKLGLFEGELCRWRICSGLWDSDSACKIPQQATSF